jgi:glycosyltransferase involved in cell wall biosynthesis
MIMLSKFINDTTNFISLVDRKIRERIDYQKKLQVVSLPQNQLNPNEITSNPNSKGNVLLSYRIEPFLLKEGEALPNDHTWYLEVHQIAGAFLDLGYRVDVIQFHNDKFRPEKHYDFFVDIRDRLEALSPYINEDCIKILHVDIANMIFRNAAECNRLLHLQQRKGTTLRPKRYEVPNLGIEYADCATVLGNDFTCGTFKYAGKPLYRVPILTSVSYPWMGDKDFSAIRKNFLWLGSGALVLKGLDLVLEAFAEMPEYHLTVCGPINTDKAFEQAFYEELYETPNIHTYGWIDVTSPNFTEVVRNCLALVYPSACEGQSGAAITCIKAGLIPIISYETGIDVDGFGVILNNSSIEEIKATVTRVSRLPEAELKNMSRMGWEYADANHTPEKFRNAYRQAIEQIIVDCGSKNSTPTSFSTNQQKVNYSRVS